MFSRIYKTENNRIRKNFAKNIKNNISKLGDILKMFMKLLISLSTFIDEMEAENYIY